MTSGASGPSSVGELVGALDAIMGTAGTAACTTIVRSPSSAGPLRRIALALDPSAELCSWAARRRAGAIFLHRHWDLRPEMMAADIPVVANHDGFDRRFGFGDNAELADALSLRRIVALAERDGEPLGTVWEGPARTGGALREQLVTLFGGIEEELAPDAPRRIRRVVIARAMNAGLVSEAMQHEADAYVTGQIRQPARAAAARAGLHVFGVGHRRSEEWGLRALRDALRLRWPDLETIEAPGHHPSAD